MTNRVAFRRAVRTGILIVGVISLLLSAGVVILHARGSETASGVTLELRSVKIEPASEEPIVVELSVYSSTNRGFRLDSIFAVLKRKGRTVGIFEEQPIRRVFSANEAGVVRLVMQPGWDYTSPEKLEALKHVADTEWVVSGEVTCPILGRREPLHLKFETESVMADE